ncbi:ATP-binding protein [Leptospira santarosai]|uniref:ATP-binding protein n=1 Tax=Leptospira santarosai TaxID=28183 RepID=UPI0007736415|nr:ATP-binding protein [Leptospira santarosai]
MKQASFKTRARIVDLLGREQIADAPTAITELLKNAVDAQADNVNVHYHSTNLLLEIEDDGLGMRPEDLLDKWLVLATDSKRGSIDDSWLKFASHEKRDRAKRERPFGEKGIGRLAVAALGKGVLVWTRWGSEKESKRSIALIHWNLFRFPKLNLEDILIPYLELGPNDDPKEFSNLLLEELRTWFKKNSKSWDVDSYSSDLRNEILNDLEVIFPKSLNGIINFEQKSGTFFGVLGTSDEVDELFRENVIKKGEDNLPSEGLRTFFAFCDPFIDSKKRLNINVFHNKEVAYKRQRDFWSSTDFDKADHYINISVDKKGFVSGKIKHYNQIHKYEYTISNLPPRQTLPGPFQIKLGYIPGESTNSIQTPENHKIFTDRLNEYGALYVYRNGIRVMPYGRYDVDFLSFEERRSKNAGRYFFSHRRMFGAIYINQLDNYTLIDKAGREGFIKNSYYRGLTTICIEIFKDLADRYFGSKAPDAKSKKNKRVSEFLIESKEKTSTFLIEYRESRKLIAIADKALNLKLNTLIENIDQGAKGDREIINNAEVTLLEIKESLDEYLYQMISEIPDLAQPSQKNLASWDSYLTDRQQFELKWEREIIRQTNKLDKLLSKYANKIERIKGYEQKLNKNEEKLTNILVEKRNILSKYANDIAEIKSYRWLRDHLELLKNIPKEQLGNDPASAVFEGGEKSLIVFEEALAKQRKLLREELEPYWDGILREISRIANARSLERALGELSREKENLEEQIGISAELAQIGLIVEGIDHEYRTLFKSVKTDIEKLEKSSLSNQDLDRIDHLKNTFLAIDERLRSLSPLFRTEKTVYSKISGQEIRAFVESRYSESERSGVTIGYTKNFISFVWEQIPRSVLFGAILNVVNNALFWVQKTSNKEPQIQFSITPNGFVISDNGPGVAPRDRERIFDSFFSRKPHGRGLGLYLARTALKGHGLDLMYSDNNLKGALSGSNFVFIKDTNRLEDSNDN